MKKKMLIGLGVAFLLAMLVGNVSALVAPPLPCSYCWCSNGFTPGFWKHNIAVALGEPGEYSCFDDSGNHLIYSDVLGYVEETGQWGTGEAALEAALAALSAQGPGSVTTRTWAANWLNWAAGFGPFVD